MFKIALLLAFVAAASCVPTYKYTVGVKLSENGVDFDGVAEKVTVNFRQNDEPLVWNNVKFTKGVTTLLNVNDAEVPLDQIPNVMFMQWYSSALPKYTVFGLESVTVTQQEPAGGSKVYRTYTDNVEVRNGETIDLVAA